jgi:hypothetical protein
MKGFLLNLTFILKIVIGFKLKTIAATKVKALTETTLIYKAFTQLLQVSEAILSLAYTLAEIKRGDC